MTATPTPEDAAIKAIVDPYAALLTTYNNTVIGKTDRADRHAAGLHPGDQRRQPAGRRLGLRSWKKSGVPVDFHLSGAMTNKKIADSATPATPVHPQGVRHVHGHALRELAGGAEHERPAAQGSAGARVPELLLLQVCTRLWRLLLLHHLHDRHQQGQRHQVRGYVSRTAQRPQRDLADDQRHAGGLQRCDDSTTTSRR